MKEQYYKTGSRVRLAPAHIAALQHAKLYCPAMDDAVGEVRAYLGDGVLWVRFKAPGDCFLRRVHARNLTPA